jgi:uncharacterized protein YndB with AHSA1/START domain
MRRDLIAECLYAEPVELVWSAITDSDILKEWLMETISSRLSARTASFE